MFFLAQRVGQAPELEQPHQHAGTPSNRLEPDRLVIRGTNFGVTTAPVVMLASTPLEVLGFNDEEIVARLPLDVPADRYRLC